MAKYQVLSPDGFRIEYTPTTYRSFKKAIEAFKKWKNNYKLQGYYSSVQFGRIPLVDLEDYCQFIKI